MLCKFGGHLPVHGEGSRPPLMLYKLGVYVCLLGRCSIGERFNVMETLEVCKQITYASFFFSFFFFFLLNSFFRKYCNSMLSYSRMSSEVLKSAARRSSASSASTVEPATGASASFTGLIISRLGCSRGWRAWVLTPAVNRILIVGALILRERIFFFLLCFYTSRCIIIIFN